MSHMSRTYDGISLNLKIFLAAVLVTVCLVVLHRDIDPRLTREIGQLKSRWAFCRRDVPDLSRWPSFWRAHRSPRRSILPRTARASPCDVSNATALHLDLFVPESSTPTGWHQLGFVVIGEGGEVGTAALGFVAGQWNTLEIPLTPDQAKMLTNVKGLYLLRNQDSNTPWNGPIHLDNLRAVVPAQ